MEKWNPQRWTRERRLQRIRGRSAATAPRRAPWWAMLFPPWSTGLSTRMATWQRCRSTRSNWRPWRSELDRYFFSCKYFVLLISLLLTFLLKIFLLLIFLLRMLCLTMSVMSGCEGFKRLCWTGESEPMTKTSRRSDWRRRKLQKSGWRWFVQNIQLKNTLVLDVIVTFHAFIAAIKVLGEALGHVDDEDGVLVKVGQIWWIFVPTVSQG